MKTSTDLRETRTTYLELSIDEMIKRHKKDTELISLLRQNMARCYAMKRRSGGVLWLVVGVLGTVLLVTILHI